MSQKTTQETHTPSASNTTDSSKKTEKTSVNLLRTEKGTHITTLLLASNPRSGKQFQICTILDCGADTSYITEYATEQLHLTKSDPRLLDVETLAHDKPTEIRTAAVPLCSSNKKGFSLDLVVDTTPHIPQSVKVFDLDKFRSDYPQYSAYNFADPGENEVINMVIGNDYLFDLLTNAPKITVKSGFHLVESIFGWLLVGRQAQNNFEKSTILMTTSTAVARLWWLDTIGINCWPWRSFPPNLPTNFGLALGQLNTQWCKYSPELLHAYDTIIKQQIESEIVEPAPNPKRENVHYIPHHAILMLEKSTPLRIVYNSSAKQQ